MKYAEPIWKMVSKAAMGMGKNIFTASDIVAKVHEFQPDVPEVSIRTYEIAMAPNHPSSGFYPSTQRLHGMFEYLGA